jgi:hypothetical protein
VLSCGQHRLSVLFVFDHFERDLCNIVSIGTFCLIFVCCLFFVFCLFVVCCLLDLLGLIGIVKSYPRHKASTLLFVG